MPSAKAWAEDAGLMRIVCNTVSGPYLALLGSQPPAINPNGRLDIDGGWWLQFHSRNKSENLHLVVPCRGPITKTVLEAPEGRYWPSDGDQIVRDGWIDSVEAVRIAGAALSQSVGLERIQQLELSSRAKMNVRERLGPPFRERMFPMETSWRVSLLLSSEKETAIASVTVPAHGDGPASVAVHAFDKHGRQKVDHS